MKVRINREVLKQAAAKSAKIIGKSIQPIMECLYLEIKEDKIYVSAISNDVTICTTAEGAVCDENFECLLTSDLFLSVLGKMKSEYVILEMDKKSKEPILQLRGGSISMKIHCLDTALWNKAMPIKDPDLSVDTDFLLPAIAQCKHALDPKGDLPQKSSFCVHCKENEWKLTALDGFRISSRGSAPEDANEILLPGHTLILLESILETNVHLEIKGEVVCIKDSFTEVRLRTVAAKYFDLKSTLNKPAEHYVKLKKADLVDVLELACVLFKSDDKERAVRLDINADTMTVIAKDKVANDMNSIIQVESDFDKPFSIGFNPSYLLDALKSIQEDEIRLGIINHITPLSIKGESYMEMVLPVKIQ
ncbi:MAG: DNA polymerase III subunit beta [Lachnospiraceae bacterium]|nr:DNA polymerase III subunit beta [Lachnospiraceae bacterium]